MAGPDPVESLAGALVTAVTAIAFLARALAKEKRRKRAAGEVFVVPHDGLEELIRHQKLMVVRQDGMSVDIAQLRQDFDRAQDRLSRNEKLFMTHLNESRADSQLLREVSARLNSIEGRLPS